MSHMTDEAKEALNERVSQIKTLIPESTEELEAMDVAALKGAIDEGQVLLDKLKGMRFALDSEFTKEEAEGFTVEKLQAILANDGVKFKKSAKKAELVGMLVGRQKSVIPSIQISRLVRRVNAARQVADHPYVRPSQ